MSNGSADWSVIGPELLEVCKDFSKRYGDLWDLADPTNEKAGFLSFESCQKYDEIHGRMFDLIAKATGE